MRVLRDYVVVIVTVLMFIALAVTSDVFMTTNLLNILDQQASIGIIACAVTLVLIAGAFDLSVGAMYAFGGVVAAIVVGGTSIWGGEGAIWRTLVGVAFLGLLANGFNLLGVEVKYQQIVQGMIILLAAGADAYARRQRR